MALDAVAATVGVVAGLPQCIESAKQLYDLRSRYKDASILITAIYSESMVIAASLSQVQSLLQRGTLENTPELQQTFDQALTGCRVVYTCLDQEVRKLAQKAGDGDLTFRDKTRYLWKEETFKELLQQIRGQQSALSLLIQGLQMESIADIKRLVQDNSHRMEQVVKRSNTLRDKHPNINVPATILDEEPNPKRLSDVQSVLNSTEFTFDEEIINSKAYQRAMAMTKVRADAKNPEIFATDGDLIDPVGPSLDGETAVNEQAVASAVVDDAIIGDAVIDFKSLNLSPLRQAKEQTEDIGRVKLELQADEEPQSALLDALEKTMLPFMPPQSTSSRVTSCISVDSEASKHTWSNDSAIGISRGSSLSSSNSQSTTKTTPLDSESVTESGEEQEDEKPPPLPPRPTARTKVDYTPISRDVKLDSNSPLVPEPLTVSKGLTSSSGELNREPGMMARHEGPIPPQKMSYDTLIRGSWASEKPMEIIAIADTELHSIWSSLLTAEQKFIDLMTKLRKTFHDPTIKKWPMLEKHIDVIIIADELAELHRKHLLEPASAMVSTHDLAAGDPTLFEFWAIKTQKLYKKYAQQLPHAESSIRLTCIMEPKFPPFLESLRSSLMPSGKGWEECLRLPVTQLNAYVEQLQMLIGKAPVVTGAPTEQYKKSLLKALEIVTKLQESCNRYIVDSTKREEIQTLYRRIELVKTNPLSHLGLAETGRHIVQQGSMAIKVNDIGSWKTVHLVLLDNYLLWGRVKPPKAWKHQERRGDNIWVLENPIPVSKLDVSLPPSNVDIPQYPSFKDNIPKNTALYQIFVKDKESAFKPHSLGVFSVEERREWYDQLKSVADDMGSTLTELST